jgi:hypothetical protein
MLARRWSDALTMIDDADSRSRDISPQQFSNWEIYFTAARTGKPVDIAKARNLALSAPGGANSSIILAVEMLSALGLVDDAFTVVQRYTPGAPLTGAISGFLFNPLTEPMRRDPRFISLAARMGMVDYWRSGKWPDYCSEPGLPYDCRKEASRVTGAK